MSSASINTVDDGPPGPDDDTDWKALYRRSLFEIHEHEQTLAAWCREVLGLKLQLEGLLAERAASAVADEDPALHRTVLGTLNTVVSIDQPAQVKLLEAALRSLRPNPQRRQTADESDPKLGGSNGSRAQHDDLDVLRAELTGLIETLLEAMQGRDSLSALRTAVTQAGDRPALVQCRQTLATLIEAELADLREQVADLGGFLRRTVDHLLAVQDQLLASGANVGRGSRNRLALDTAMGEAMTQMQQALASNVELDVLKAIIDNQLGDIDRSLTVFRSEEDRRLREYEQAMAGLQSKIEELKRETQSLQSDLSIARDQAFQDALTQLPNRAACDQFLAAACARCARGGGPVSLVIIDVDNFKSINDRFGHPTGDRVLQTVASQLSGCLRGNDFIGRFGGEEFMLVTPGTGLENALAVAQKLRNHLERCTFRHHQSVFPVTISCGIAECLQSDTSQSLYERADAKLYEAKRSGRNRCVG